jgi:hypothetical protein
MDATDASERHRANHVHLCTMPVNGLVDMRVGWMQSNVVGDQESVERVDCSRRAPAQPGPHPQVNPVKRPSTHVVGHRIDTVDPEAYALGPMCREGTAAVDL